MKNMVKKVLFILSMCVLAVLGTACEGEKISQKVNLAMVVGAHANTYVLPFDSNMVVDRIYDACYTQGTVTLVNCDGEPGVYAQYIIPELPMKGLSEEKQKTIAMGYVNQIQSQLSQVVAVKPEVNTLKAIAKSAQAFAGGEEGTEKILMVLDSGLSTVEPLDFTTDLLYVETTDIVNALKQLQIVPELNGVHVYWSFLGETAYPQEELSAKQKEKLKELWRAILEAGGAEEVVFTNEFASATPYTDMPEVSLVEVEEEKIEVNGNKEMGNPVVEIILEPMETIVIDSSSVNFVGNSAVYVDTDVAVTTLAIVAEQLLSNPDNVVWVVGTTATGNESFTKELSEERAKAVKQTLIGLGVPEEQMQVAGLGCNDYWHLPDLDSNGCLIEEYAKQNRKVMIIDVNGPDAEHIRGEE